MSNISFRCLITVDSENLYQLNTRRDAEGKQLLKCSQHTAGLAQLGILYLCLLYYMWAT